jgi:hypothetical protein
MLGVQLMLLEKGQAGFKQGLQLAIMGAGDQQISLST